MRMRLLIVAGLAALASLPGPAAARTPLRSVTLRADLRPSRLLVSPPRPIALRPMRWSRERLHTGMAAAVMFAGGRAVVGLAEGADGAAVTRDYGVSPVSLNMGLRALEVTGGADRLRALDAAVGSDARLRYVEPVRERATLHRRNDPLTTALDPVSRVPYEWQFSHVGVDRALNVERGSPAIVVGVIDTGYAAVPDLAGKVAQSWYFLDQATSSLDTLGHGTFVSSLIGATNDDGQGMAGFCGGCRLMIVKDLELDSYTMATAIHTLTDAGVRIINMSFGGSGISLVEKDAMNYAISKGVLLVAAAGNEGGTVDYPAAYLQPAGGAPGYGLAVGASDAADRPASWSSWGDHLSLLAPGTFTDKPLCNVGVLGALPSVASLFDSACGTKFTNPVTGARYGYSDGTSFAAPEAAGVAALVWAAKPELTSSEVVSILLKSATRAPGAPWSPDHGWGILNAAAAVQLATGKSTDDAVVVGEPRFTGQVQGGQSASATADVTYQDGVTVLDASVTCTAHVGSRTLEATEQRLDNGTVRCTWSLPADVGGQRLEAHVDVRDPLSGATGSRDFGADVLDVMAPKTQALRSSGRYGARLTLRFRVSDETGVARRLVRVYRGSKPLFSSSSGLGPVDSGALRSLVWKAPSRRPRGAYKFCVWAWDRSDNESDQSCARISLR